MQKPLLCFILLCQPPYRSEKKHAACIIIEYVEILFQFQKMLKVGAGKVEILTLQR